MIDGGNRLCELLFIDQLLRLEQAQQVLTRLGVRRQQRLKSVRGKHLLVELKRDYRVKLIHGRDPQTLDFPAFIDKSDAAR